MKPDLTGIDNNTEATPLLLNPAQMQIVLKHTNKTS